MYSPYVHIAHKEAVSFNEQLQRFNSYFTDETIVLNTHIPTVVIQSEFIFDHFLHSEDFVLSQLLINAHSLLSIVRKCYLASTQHQWCLHRDSWLFNEVLHTHHDELNTIRSEYLM